MVDSTIVAMALSTIHCVTLLATCQVYALVFYNSSRGIQILTCLSRPFKCPILLLPSFMHVIICVLSTFFYISAFELFYLFYKFIVLFLDIMYSLQFNENVGMIMYRTTPGQL